MKSLKHLPHWIACTFWLIRIVVAMVISAIYHGLKNLSWGIFIDELSTDLSLVKDALHGIFCLRQS